MASQAHGHIYLWLACSIAKTHQLLSIHTVLQWPRVLNVAQETHRMQSHSQRTVRQELSAKSMTNSYIQGGLLVVLACMGQVQRDEHDKR